MTDVFKDLPRLHWRGIEVPVAERKVSFEQELATHKYAYRDDELLESLGRKNWRFDYTIPFREDIRKGPYRNLYVATFSTFLDACRDRSAGSLQDPILGEYTARCVSVTIQTDVNKRDGEDLQVSFIHSPDLEEIEELTEVSGLPGAVQTGLRIGDSLPRAIRSPDPVFQYKLTSAIEKYNAKLDALDQILSIGSQVSSYTDRLNSSILQFESRINTLTDVIGDLDQKLFSPENAFVYRSLRRLSDSVARLKQQVTPGRRVLTTVLLEEMSLASAAAFLSNSMSEMIELNPGINTLSIPANTVVSYYEQIQ